MRATTLLNNVLGIKFTRVTGAQFTADGLVCDVEPTTEIPRCGGCGHQVRKVYDQRKPRRWRHLDLAGMSLELQYSPRRLCCSRCGVTTEMVPWADPMSWFTHAFEETVGYLAQMASKTVVSAMMRVAWATVGAIIGRVVERRLPHDILDGLTHIGVDELSYRKHHKYVTIVVDHVTGRVVWAREGKNADTLRTFFQELGSERCALLQAVTIDMSNAYISAVSESATNTQIIFDRFHVQRLVHDALDEVRRAEVRTIEDPEERSALKHTRFALQKNPWNLTGIERAKLTELPKANATLYRAYLLKESFAAILDRRQPNVALAKLEEWISWATRSGLKPFAKAARTIGRHLDGIVAYVASGLSNARSEGTNGKVRTITRRSYGLHGASSLIALIHLCCSGLALQPVHTWPRIHQT
ncbi:ISL3 family transposase [Sorangium sp. So ce448]|uniref:ISL3 family transposase n=1 Tax=Sorangium sp. So ce448 TaxID=3133314 RepID=UPI003F61D09F